MAMTKSVFPPSISERLIHCPGSRRICAGFDVMVSDDCGEFLCGDRADKELQEGVECHMLAAYKLKKALNQDVASLIGSLSHYSAVMETAAEVFCNIVMTRVRELWDGGLHPTVYIEQRVDASALGGQGCVGISDCLVVTERTVDVFDMKYGRGVLVSAEENLQLMCYALGAMCLCCDCNQIAEIRMSIVQPRRKNISTCIMNPVDLLQWANVVLAPAIRLIHEGKGEFHAGPHCQFCPAKAICRKRAESNSELAEFMYKLSASDDGSAKPEILSNDDVAFILSRMGELATWLNDLKTWATQQAISGVHFPGFKLVHSRVSPRKFTDEAAVAQAVRDAGYEPFKQVLRTPTEFKQLLGEEVYGNLLARYIDASKSTKLLVPESNPRPAIRKAADEFNLIKEDNYNVSTERFGGE